MLVRLTHPSNLMCFFIGRDHDLAQLAWRPMYSYAHILAYILAYVSYYFYFVVYLLPRYVRCLAGFGLYVADILCRAALIWYANPREAVVTSLPGHFVRIEIKTPLQYKAGQYVSDCLIIRFSLSHAVMVRRGSSHYAF